jgi:dCMP deaminase
MKQKYINAFMEMTERFAQTSEANKLKVGACLIKNGNPIAYGINGSLPKWHTNACEDENGDTIVGDVIHAEINALNKLRKIGETSIGATLMTTVACCIRCAHEIVDAGIVKVYYRDEYKNQEGLKYLKDNGVVVHKLDRV